MYAKKYGGPAEQQAAAPACGAVHCYCLMELQVFLKADAGVTICPPDVWFKLWAAFKNR
ncbi:hypothetical protein [Paenibacillus sonchi]|uniref:hypothetical protein n=1 Tax=Paenibacillus sonchi TaxID=373687 RepID=UPI001E31B9B3|nr:hypothetical protein [Paenibacillus sonchi]MCE3198293.1 hypothetical protein [Paenibacillus sonchi]